MDSRTLLLAVTVLSVVFYHQVEAENESRLHTRDSEHDYSDRRDIMEQLFKIMSNVKKVRKSENNSEFYFNYVFPKTPEELKARGLKCMPGRTVIRITEKEPEQLKAPNSSDEDNDRLILRSHMNFGKKEEFCKVCVCSIGGKHEYCSGRPAMNVNECLRLTMIDEEFKANGAYDHTRGFPFRIRRDYIWHNDEIPYEPKAKCVRGSSYYTNNKNANDTDIDVSADVESILDYANSDVCLYCVCSVDGRGVNCIDRDLWFCDNIRNLRGRKDAIRDMYGRLFQQDRPTYFRQFSWRLRRTMDDGINEFIDTGGDTLCCSHPDGHRRQLHNNVRNKIHQMRRKVPKENLMGGSPGGDYADFIVNND